MLILMPTLAMLNGWELVLIFAVILVLFGAKTFPGMARGLGEGFQQFRNIFDREANEAGESLGGIFGKPAAEALTHDNQTAELYDPAVFHRDETTRRVTKFIRFRRWLRICRAAWRVVLQRLKAKM